jgi:hypothetical protein
MWQACSHTLNVGKSSTEFLSFEGDDKNMGYEIWDMRCGM